MGNHVYNFIMYVHSIHMYFGLVCRRQMCSMTDDHTCLQKSPSFPAQRCPESRSLGVDPDAGKTRHKLRCLTQWSLSYGDAQRPTQVLCLQSFFGCSLWFEASKSGSLVLLVQNRSLAKTKACQLPVVLALVCPSTGKETTAVLCSAFHSIWVDPRRQMGIHPVSMGTEIVSSLTRHKLHKHHCAARLQIRYSRTKRQSHQFQ